MINKKKFNAIAATSKSGKPTGKQLAMNGGLRSEVHEYDHKRPTRQVMSRYCK